MERMPPAQAFIRFACIGAIGFAVDAAVLQLLVSAGGWSPFAARAVSFPVALTCTFLLNRAWTFRSLRMSAGRAYGAYGAIQAIGALLNLAVFSFCLLLAPPLYERPVIALGIGALVTLFFNFYASRKLVFNP
jgi:putative flippase GtrA